MNADAAGRVCIVGAGIAGLVTAKVLREDGFDVAVFDKDATIGGVWAASRTYPGLRTNNPRDLYAFSDHPFPRDAGDFPSAARMRDYLASYARRFAIHEHVRLRTEVLRVERCGTEAGEPVRWRVRVRSAQRHDCEETLDFDYVVVCNGVFSKPRTPQIDGVERFAGLIRHSSELAGMHLAPGKRVVVLGGSKSALDCAVWAAREGAFCTLVFRTAYWMWPRYLFGVVNLQWLMFSRMAAALLGSYRASAAAARRHGRVQRMVAASWHALSRVLRWHARGGGALVPDFDPPEHIETMGAGNEAYALVRLGKIVPKRTEVRRFSGADTVELANGETVQADLVVFATGFTQEVAFLEPAVRHDIERDDGFRLFRMILPPEHRTLAFNGYNSSTMCQLTAEIAAHWISDCFRGRLPLPSVREMDTEITAVRSWLDRAMPSRSRGFFLGPWVIPYVDDLLRDMGVPTRRRRNALAEHVLPAWPSNYVTIGEERRRRAPERSRPALRSRQPRGFVPSLYARE